MGVVSWIELGWRACKVGRLEALMLVYCFVEMVAWCSSELGSLSNRCEHGAMLSVD